MINSKYVTVDTIMEKVKKDLPPTVDINIDDIVEYVWEALDILGVDRIDHGNAITTDKELMARIAKDNIGLTMCPLSNQCLQVVPDLRNHQALQLMNAGVKVTVNSDDPAYFGGYLN